MADPDARPFYLDCDTGIDDAIALTCLMATPSVDLRGIGTVSGNTDAVTAARNTVDLLALLDRPDIPVAVGAQHPLSSRFGGGSPEVHGANGTGDVHLPRADAEPVTEAADAMLIRLAHEHPGRLQVVAIGPLTNLARALRQDPALPELVGSVTVMGGAALVLGNRTPVAEANILYDPEAAAEVLAAPWEVTLIPLDVTMANLLDEGQREQLAAVDHPVMPPLVAMLERYVDFYAGIFGRPSSAVHDPLAAAVAADTVRLGLAPMVRVQVDTTEGPGRGQTICDLRGRYAGHPTPAGAGCRVVLELAEDFAPHLLRTFRRLDPSSPGEPVRSALTVVGSINIDLTAVCQLEIELETVRETARRATGFFALNAAPAMPLPGDLVDRCDLIIVNETECALIPGLADAELVAVTYGGKGSAMYAHGRQVASAPGHEVAVVSTVGAGDAFCAALVLALASGLDHERALRAANAVGAHAVGDPSSQPAFFPLGHCLPPPEDVGRTPSTEDA